MPRRRPVSIRLIAAAAASLSALVLALAGGVAAAEETAVQPAAPAAPAKLDPKKLKAPKATPQLLEKGKAVFSANCVACHGDKGDGKGLVGAALVPPPRDFTKDPFKQGTRPEEVFVTISEGLPNTPMVGWPQLADDDRWALAHYVLAFVPAPAKGAKAAAGKR